jgi:tetratricopeptide (TPR) repeat protein
MKRAVLILIICFFGCSINSGAAQEATVARGQTMLKHGAYREAIATFNALLQKNPKDAEAQQGLVSALFETGEYAEAEKKAREFLKDTSSSLPLRLIVAEVQLETGRYQEAATEFEGARRDAKGPLFLRATYGLGRALLSQGKEDEARRIYPQFIDYYNQNRPTSAEELTLIAQALIPLEKFKDANELLIDAREADQTYIDAYIAQGELLNEKYNYEESPSLFRDALKINENSPRAQVGLAESLRLQSSEAPSAAVDRALKVNPNYVGALALRAWFDIEADRPESAVRAIEHALKVNPNSVKALALRAAMSYLADKKTEFEADTRKALAINPRAGEFFATLAHFAVINRRYSESVEFGRRAIELSPRMWRARTELGIQLMRVGRVAEGRQELETAFENDPYNIWAKNTLDLLDSIQDYRDTLRGPFLLKTAPAETDVIAPYAASLLEEAHKKLAEKYRFTPRAPITVELYPNHEDFAVRSLGLPGLGALGICFGQVIAMDSPTARPAGEFNWGSTLWHEYAHVVTLQITDHRIPRWFSEGLSVFEERRARGGWGDNWTIQRLKAYAEGRFVKLNDLDSAFLRPKSPDQVPLAYFQASLVCDFIEERHRFDAILKMLALYKEGLKTPEVFKRAVSLSPDDFDKAFNEWLREKTSGYVEALNMSGGGPADTRSAAKEALTAIVRARPNDYFANLRLGAIYKTEGDLDRAIEHLRRAATLFPFYGGEGNPYVQLADIYESRGEKSEAASALESLTRSSDTNVEAFKRLAQLKLAMGDRAGAIDALNTSFYIHPFDAGLHKLAGDVYLEKGDAAEAAREYRVAVTLKPPDMAEAHYDLARALDVMGSRADARREVLRALEIAPGFEKAQMLLVKLRGSR